MKTRFYTLLLLFISISSLQAQDSSRVVTAHVNDRGRLMFQTEDKRFSWELATRMYLDAATYFANQDISNATYKSSEFKFSNGISARRIRLAMKGNFEKNWFGAFSVDYVYDEVSVEDCYMGYKIEESCFLQAGNFKEPFSMEEMSSSRYLPFMERSMVVNALSPGRSLGVAITKYTNHLYASGGIFGQTLGADQKTANRGNDGMAGTARLAIFPINSKEQTLHLGVCGTYRSPNSNGSDDRSVEFRTMPESYVDRRRFDDALINNVNHYASLGGELAYRYDRLLLQGEYIYTNVSRYAYSATDEKTNLSNAAFNGWYADAVYTIWGKPRKYDEERAAFQSGKVKGKKGTLEAGLRYSYINLNDFSESTEAYWITGGKSNIITAQVNWAPNNNIKLSLSYALVDNDKWANADDNIKYNKKELYESLPNGLDFSTLQFRITGIF